MNGSALDKGNPTRDQIRTHEQESVRSHYLRLDHRFGVCVMRLGRSFQSYTEIVPRLSLQRKHFFK